MRREGEETSLRDDDEALLEAIGRYRHQMYGIAYAYMRNETDALEAIQETVCRVWLKRRTLRDESYFGTWMIRILINVCMDERRKREKMRPVPFVALERAGETPDLSVRLDLAERVAKLPPPYRMVVALKYYRDMTLTDIAELLEKPEGTVKTWLHKALKMLRGDMAQGEEGMRHGRTMAEGWSRG